MTISIVIDLLCLIHWIADSAYLIHICKPGLRVGWRVKSCSRKSAPRWLQWICERKEPCGRDRSHTWNVRHKCRTKYSSLIIRPDFLTWYCIFILSVNQMNELVTVQLLLNVMHLVTAFYSVERAITNPSEKKAPLNELQPLLMQYCTRVEGHFLCEC